MDVSCVEVKCYPSVICEYSYASLILQLNVIKETFKPNICWPHGCSSSDKSNIPNAQNELCLTL